MDGLKLFFLEDPEFADHEAISKGYRNDVFVNVSKNLYNVRVYDIVRLQQDFETEVQEYGYYSIETNLILVKEVSNEHSSIQ
ncbi:hypothetical protein [Paenibacillus taiwanensis]|uniref:hypothetical protein n=1 Tax=Paenibacillus taiwanensis TaxID=401638 RepID=UPI00040A3783|nr:hypothetical protein [Paenibacillus taiwanensis]